MMFGFVVLHYKTYNDTKECVDSLLELEKNENGMLSHKIIIVDNNSQNGSVELLESHFKNRREVILLKNQSNLGFSKGNNIGIIHARKIGCDFVCVLNNDTIIEQKDFVKRCTEYWKQYQFSVCGPKIVSLIDGLDQNPFMLHSHFVKDKKDAMRMFTVGLIKYMTVLFHLPLWWEKDTPERKGFTDGLENKILDNEKEDFLLYGACLILSPSFFEKYNKLCDLTFMYEEETILYILARELHIKMMYLPQLLIFHKEQSATNNSLGLGRQKILFGYREDFRSRIQILKITMKKKNLNFLKMLLTQNVTRAGE